MIWWKLPIIRLVIGGWLQNIYNEGYNKGILDGYLDGKEVGYSAGLSDAKRSEDYNEDFWNTIRKQRDMQG